MNPGSAVERSITITDDGKNFMAPFVTQLSALLSTDDAGDLFGMARGKAEAATSAATAMADLLLTANRCEVDIFDPIAPDRFMRTLEKVVQAASRAMDDGPAS